MWVVTVVYCVGNQSQAIYCITAEDQKRMPQHSMQGGHNFTALHETGDFTRKLQTPQKHCLVCLWLSCTNVQQQAKVCTSSRIELSACPLYSCTDGAVSCASASLTRANVLACLGDGPAKSCTETG